jgi:EAL domain-containing protein (putative c-di-GMP-specific phosphodiesterase class I)
LRISDLSFLVVEDHDFQRETLIEMLRGLQAKDIHAAANGQEAFDFLVSHRTPIDVIISDLDMPTMDGLEFMRRAGEAGYRRSVILVSALDRTLLSAAEAMTKAYGVRLLGAISKPITQASLEALLENHGAPEPKLQARFTQRASYSLDEIMDGLEKNQFEPFFQPKVDLATRRVVGAEALARWRHPQQGIVPPAAFIKILEDSGKIDELMWLMLRKGIAFCSSLNAGGLESSIAVNLSLKSLNNTDLASRITEISRAHNLEADKVCLEITETAATTNLGAALENLTRLRMKGFGLSIDDFGTGYSSMQQLTRIPFTELKIDRSFIANSSTHEPARVLLSSSLQIARQLNIKAVAEGVETQQNWDLLQELGCDLAQGYFIAEPMDARSYMNWVQTLATNTTSMFVA